MKKIFFAWQQIPSTIISEILASCDFDGVVLDAEHSNFSNESLFSCIQTIKLKDKKCGVRFTSPDDRLVRSCLDAGIDYAIFSTVESLKYCEKITKMCNYPRWGGSRGQGLVRENMWGKFELDKKKVKTVAMIETKKGIDILPKIEKEYNIDLFLIGMYDLSASLGCIGDFKNKIFTQYLEKFKKCIPKEKSGIHLVRNYDNMSEIEKEYSFFALGMDTTVLLDKYSEINKKARE